MCTLLALLLLLLLPFVAPTASPYSNLGRNGRTTATLNSRTLSGDLLVSATPGGTPTINPTTGFVSYATTVLTPPAQGRSGTPLPYAVDHRLLLNKNDDRIIPLRNRLEIADAGETSFPIYVPDDFVVQDVKFTVRGFFHEHAGDLVLKLKHNVDRVGMPSLAHNATASARETASLENLEANEVVVANKRLGAMTFGHPRSHPFPNTDGNGYPAANKVRGDGLDYIVHDLDSINMALHKPTQQSSTAYGGLSSKAVDGIRNGHYGSDSVTHTAGHGTTIDPQAWWQVDLGQESAVGTIGVWNRIQENNVDEIQTITADAAETMAGTFQLSFNFSGVVTTTDPIAHNAPARIADEDTASVGESMQAKLQGLSNVGTVLVQRQVFDAHNGGFTWIVTFISEPGNLDPILVADISGLTAQGSSVSFQTRMTFCFILVVVHSTRSSTHNSLVPRVSLLPSFFPLFCKGLHNDSA